MRKGIGWLLVVLGAFLLSAGLVAKFWAVDAAKKTPEEVNSTTRLSGTADKLNPATGDVEHLPVKVASVTKSDTKKSDDRAVVFVNYSCIVIDENDPPDCVTKDDPEKRLVTATEPDVFATDRKTALAVNADKYLPADAVPHQGLVNKWPFDAQKKTYPYWDGLLREAVPATFDRTEYLQGLKTYVYTVKVEEQPAEVVKGIDGLYSTDKSIWVEPDTGKIVNQTQHEVRTLENGDPLIDLDIAFTPEQVKTDVADAKDGVQSLRLLSTVLPLVGIIAGLLLLAVGLFLATGGRNGRRTEG